MAIDCGLDPGRQLAFFRAHDRFTGEDLLSYGCQVTAVEHSLTGFQRISDLRPLDDVAVTADGVLGLIDTERRCAGPHRWGDVLMVAGRETVVAVATIYQLLAQGMPYEVRIFGELTALRHHLGLDIDDPSIRTRQSA
jgi:hypothetical protein